MFIDNYYFSVNIKDCLFLEFENPLKIEELIKIKQNFCNIVGNMSLCYNNMLGHCSLIATIFQ